MSNISVLIKGLQNTYLQQQIRTFISFPWRKKKPDPCAHKSCEKPLFFEMINTDKLSDLEKMCKERKGDGPRELPDVDNLPGTKYKTCGPSILIQEVSTWPCPTQADQKELRRLEKMEAHPSLKEQLQDPLPPFTSVEQRLVDLSDHKVHPLYMKMQSIPKRKINFCATTKAFTISSTTAKPKQIEINTEILEKKNILVDLKRSEPPQETIEYGMEKKLLHLEELKRITKKAVHCAKYDDPNKKTTPTKNYCPNMSYSE
ncbi:hypothetical protein WA026_019788 [Henosepilachna vigintioctopunctata]|uniref:Testicular haploid expressed protein n=1 Tax=Henosepilachna vigintioctopunctata TaxID=420089 RepID=A0AAW1VF39_9CUCU